MANPAEHGGRRRRRLPILLDARELELRTWVQMVRTFNRIERRMEQALERHGLSLAQFDVLATLDFAEGLSQQELAERLLVTKGNICGLIDRMAVGGLVERRADAHDRRMNRMFLTSGGRAVLKKAGPQQIALVKKLMSVFSESELQRLFQFFDRLEEANEE
jgi:MarR family transcriptional regulator, organic hydroperoxide resistance regulator